MHFSNHNHAAKLLTKIIYFLYVNIVKLILFATEF
jgi:hypothetical protein